MNATIFALSSGAPPAAIGIIRVSGPSAASALSLLVTGAPLPARTPVLRTLRDAGGEVLDRALVLWFPGPSTATGEDLAEIHCHGGRAVVTAILKALADVPGLREAEPGEFTRRAFANGRIDLAEAEGLADLLAAETELQRRSAIRAVDGDVSRRIEEWRSVILGLAAAVEAVIDFADEDDVAQLPAEFGTAVAALAGEIAAVVAQPAVDRLRDGVRVAFAGPPNAGKSSLFNALVNDNAAIVTAEAGTTRDIIERPVAMAGVPFVLVDTAGIRDQGAGEIESLGIARAREQMALADIVLWLGDPAERPDHAIQVQAKADCLTPEQQGDNAVSVVTGQGLDRLAQELVAAAREILPRADSLSLNRRQKARARAAADALFRVDSTADLLLVAENLREARQSLDQAIGRDSTEEMLDALFARFCIGK